MFNLNKIKTAAVVLEEQTTETFKASRTTLLNSLVVELPNGKKFDANEEAQNRLMRAIKCCELVGKQDNDTLYWSLADTGSGVRTEITFAELKEAFVLAVENMAAIWLR